MFAGVNGNDKYLMSRCGECMIVVKFKYFHSKHLSKTENLLKYF